MEKVNGGEFVDVDGDEHHPSYEHDDKDKVKKDVTLYGVLHRLIYSILFPNTTAASPLFHRIKISFCDNLPLFPEASRNTSLHLLRWTRSRSGTTSPLRLLLLISVGTIALLLLTGLLVFMLFFLAATVNAIIISLLMSLVAAGGFLALFFACLTAVYIGALSVAVFVISTTTISALIAVLITTGWIGFFWTLWLATKKSVGLAKHSLSVTGSALSAYSSTRHGRHHYYEPRKGSD